MTRLGVLRLLIILTGVMGAAGVMLAAASAHLPDASRLASASSMLLFHAAAVAALAGLIDRGLVHLQIGLFTALILVIGTALFAGDLTMRQYVGHGLFPMAAPTGGSAMIVGWVALAVAAAWPRKAA